MPNKAASPCTFPGCRGRSVDRGRCVRHKRGTTTQRGYNEQHKRIRAGYQLAVAQGRAVCWRCGQPIQPNEPWDLGHDDTDRRVTRGPEHANRCNRSTAARRLRSR